MGSFSTRPTAGCVSWDPQCPRGGSPGSSGWTVRLGRGLHGDHSGLRWPGAICPPRLPASPEDETSGGVGAGWVGLDLDEVLHWCRAGPLALGVPPAQPAPLSWKASFPQRAAGVGLARRRRPTTPSRVHANPAFVSVDEATSARIHSLRRGGPGRVHSGRRGIRDDVRPPSGVGQSRCPDVLRAPPPSGLGV